MNTQHTLSNDGKLEHKVVTLEDGCKFEGWFLNGERFGWGTKTYPNGAEYHGLYLNDERHGEGIKVTADGTQKFVEYDRGKKIKESLDNPRWR